MNTEHIIKELQKAILTQSELDKVNERSSSNFVSNVVESIIKRYNAAKLNTEDRMFFEIDFLDLLEKHANKTRINISTIAREAKRIAEVTFNA